MYEELRNYAKAYEQELWLCRLELRCYQSYQLLSRKSWSDESNPDPTIDILLALQLVAQYPSC